MNFRQAKQLVEPEFLEKTFIDLLERHKFRILRFCTIYAHSAEDREDLFQEIIFNIWKSLPSFKSRSDITTWLYKIALRVSMRYAQRNAQKRGLRIQLHGVDLTCQMLDDTTQEFEKQERIKRLFECISTLNETDKLIVTLYLEDLPYKEISKIIGITDNHIAVKMKRIKTKLLRCMETTT